MERANEIKVRKNAPESKKHIITKKIVPMFVFSKT